MKRILIILLLFSAILPAAAAPDYYLAGEFNGWKPNLEAYKFTQNGDTYTLKISNLKGEFKITTAAWEHQYGAGRTLEPGYVYPLTESGNGYNMKLDDSLTGTVIITFFNSNKTIRVEKELRLFLVGDFNGWLVAPVYEFEASEGKFVLLTDSFSGNFKIVSDDYSFSLGTGRNIPENEEVEMSRNGNPMNFSGSSSSVGKVKITVNPAGNAGVGSVSVEESDGSVVYYNLNGVRVENPGSGIFIRRTGNKSEKVIR